MVERKIARNKYIVAAVITFGIFFLGMTLGMVVENKRVAMIQTEFNLEKVEFESSQLQYDYLNMIDSKGSCPALYESFDKNLEKLENTRIRLNNYIVDSKINSEEFNILKRQYMIEQLRYYLLANTAKNMCDDNIARIIYFYSTSENCPDCSDQEFVLSYLRQKYSGSLYIFALDETFTDEPMISVLKKQYNITKFPSLIVEENVFQGFSTKDQLESELCITLKNHKGCND